MFTDAKSNTALTLTGTHVPPSTLVFPAVSQRRKHKPAQPWVPGKTSPAGEQVIKLPHDRRQKYYYRKINKGIKIYTPYVGRRSSALVSITRGTLSALLFFASVGTPFVLYYIALSF